MELTALPRPLAELRKGDEGKRGRGGGKEMREGFSLGGKTEWAKIEVRGREQE